MDAVIQPVITSGIEVLLWFGVFAGIQLKMINGFPMESYLSYAMWAAFFSRISTNWMYEFRMVEEVSSGKINSIIVRPTSFYEYYLSQLLGYKFVTTIVSFIFPILFAWYFHLPTLISRIPLAMLLCFYYLILVHTISFLISTIAFHFTKISAITVAKNLALWLLMGEMFPLDMMPSGFKEFFISLPFASGVYIPVGYITNRFDVDVVMNGFFSVTVGIVLFNIIAYVFWKQSLKVYTGTGA